MIFGTGIDIVEVYRMQEAIDRWGDNFIGRAFTPREIAYSSAKRFAAQHYAARFAAKEAVVKAFGEPNKFPIKWTEVEVVNDAEGKPSIRFNGNAKKFMSEKQIDRVVVSMSHSKNYAVANVILLQGE